jgi:hypothetical protein
MVVRRESRTSDGVPEHDRVRLIFSHINTMARTCKRSPARRNILFTYFATAMSRCVFLIVSMD